MHEEIELTREVEAIQIPSGDVIHLPIGMKVMITQALGGTYTVATQSGLARIKSENADALGIDLEAEKEKQSAAKDALAAGDVQGAIWEQLTLDFAAYRVLQRGFGDLGLRRIEANIMPANTASKAVIAKCGFRLEGVSPRYLQIAGVWADHERYAITAEEVPQLPRR